MISNRKNVFNNIKNNIFMKKTLFFICALALNLTASAQIFTPPKGKLIDKMYRNSDSWVK